jgi:hypothetical protein
MSSKQGTIAIVIVVMLLSLFVMGSKYPINAFAEEEKGKEGKPLLPPANVCAAHSKPYIVANITDSVRNNILVKCDGSKGISGNAFQAILNGTLYLGVCPFYFGYNTWTVQFNDNRQTTGKVFNVISWKSHDMPSPEDIPKPPKKGLDSYYWVNAVNWTYNLQTRNFSRTNSVEVMKTDYYGNKIIVGSLPLETTVFATGPPRMLVGLLVINDTNTQADGGRQQEVSSTQVNSR